MDVTGSRADAQEVKVSTFMSIGYEPASKYSQTFAHLRYYVPEAEFGLLSRRCALELA